MPTAEKAAQLGLLAIKESSGVDHPANATQLDGAEGWVVMKADASAIEGANVPELTEAQKAAAEKAKKPADMEAALARIAELEGQLKEATKKAAVPDPAAEADALAKSVEQMPADVRKYFEDQRAEVEKARAEAREAAESAAVEKNARLEREYVAKAAEFAQATIEAPKLASILRAVAEKSPEVADDLDTVLRAYDAQVKESGLFKAVGKSGDGALTAWDQIVAKADELRTNDPELTESQAITKASELHPDLVAQHRNEQKGR